MQIDHRIALGAVQPNPSLTKEQLWVLKGSREQVGVDAVHDAAHMDRGMLAGQARPGGDRRQDFASQPQPQDRPQGPASGIGLRHQLKGTCFW